MEQRIGVFHRHVRQPRAFEGVLVALPPHGVLRPDYSARLRWRSTAARKPGLVFPAAAALAISVVTYVMFPQTFVYFGRLHAIAAASVMCLPFVATRLWLCIAATAVMFAAPHMFATVLFDTRWLAWAVLAANPQLATISSPSCLPLRSRCWASLPLACSKTVDGQKVDSSSRSGARHFWCGRAATAWRFTCCTSRFCWR